MLYDFSIAEWLHVGTFELAGMPEPFPCVAVEQAAYRPGLMGSLGLIYGGAIESRRLIAAKRLSIPHGAPRSWL